MRPEREPNGVALHRLARSAPTRTTCRISRISGPSITRDTARAHRLRRALEDLVHRRFRRIRHLQLEEEPIELRFRQRIGAFHLQRVLRREHQERLIELVGRLADRHALLLHGLEQRRLRLGRRAVDLVGQDDVREDRPGLELEERAAVRVLLHDVGADDVGGHQVRRELDARELQVQDVRQRVDEAGLAHAGNALEQHVAAGQQGRDGVLDESPRCRRSAGPLRVVMRTNRSRNWSICWATGRTVISGG